MPREQRGQADALSDQYAAWLQGVRAAQGEAPPVPRDPRGDGVRVEHAGPRADQHWSPATKESQFRTYDELPHHSQV